MKKFLFTLIVLFFVAIGFIFVTLGMVKSEISEFMQNENFKVQKQEFHQNFVNSNGFFEAVITKEQIRKFLQKTEFRNRPFDDIKFRYDYSVKHSFLSISKGFTTHGVLTFLDENSSKIANDIFDTTSPITIDTTHNHNNSKIKIALKDIVRNGAVNEKSSFLLKNLILNTQINEKKEIEKIAVSFDNAEAKIHDIFNKRNFDLLDISKFSIEADFKEPIKIENFSVAYLYTTNFSSNTKCEKFALPQIVLENFASSLTQKRENSIINGEIKVSIDAVKPITTQFLPFKNLNFTLISKIPQSAAKNIDKNATDDEWAKDGILFEIKDLSMQNPEGIVLKGNFKMDLKGIGNDLEKFEKANLSGNIDLNSTLSEFVKNYKNFFFDTIATQTDEALLDDEIRVYNGDFFIDIPNDKVLMNGENVEDIIKLKNNITDNVDILETLQSNIAIYYTANCKFANLKDMINSQIASMLSEISPNSAVLTTSGKKCFLISLVENSQNSGKKPAVKIQKGEDENDKICQKAYKNSNIKAILTKNNGEFEMLSECNEE